MRILLLGLVICSTHFTSYAKQAAVAMPDSFSADAALNILKQGGNAVDAAITAQFVLAVTLPEAGNIGGGGFMLVRKNGKNDFIDYREKAPLSANKNMYLDQNGDVIKHKSVYGIFSSGVPGTVSGMWLAHKKYGSMPWDKLLQPAIELAQKGFIVHPKLGGYIQHYINRMQNKGIKVNFSEYFSHAKSGSVFKQGELAQTLMLIRDKGEAGFYQGKTAELIAQFMKENGGLITEKDLAQYQAKSRQPLLVNWRGYQLLTSPPPSSGGVAIVQWLKMYQALAPNEPLQHNSSGYIHLLSEIGKRVFADRAEYLGDPDFNHIDVEQLLSENYLSARSKEVNFNAISNTEDTKPGLKESEETTHFSIVDQWGNAVSNTTTINLGFGSGMVVTGAGFILNNEMDDFSAKPGVANVFGALGGKVNEIQPEKRMLSSMTPSMVLKDEQVVLVTGSPGGTTIISSVYQSILNVLEFDMSAKEAVNATRFHHQLWPKNVIRHHHGLTAETKKSLQEKGYKLDERRFGDMHLIVNQKGKLQAGSEASGRGKSIVINLP